MEIVIDDFVLAQAFNHIPGTDKHDEVWWRETVDEDGYIIIWANGDHHHTYRHPENLF